MKRLPEATLNGIRRTIADHAAGALEAHDVRTRHAGRVTFIEFHLVVPGQMTVSEAHQICDRVEAALRGGMKIGESPFIWNRKTRPNTLASLLSNIGLSPRGHSHRALHGTRWKNKHTGAVTSAAAAALSQGT
ncbi:cation transporter dimerization domain-containing protein [Bradyrhizobium sp. McL0615]|uniref:cation transporter dimerization domain-containing protein n=1 Tax=Bradyrhizobium sp. McL0615 TaxID=3415673 RepID=UPI003CF0FA2B